MDTSTEPVFPSKSYALSGKIMLIAIIVLFFVMILILLLHLYAHRYLRQRQPRHVITHRSRHVIFHSPDSSSSSPRGLDKAVLASLPVVEYAHEEAGCAYSTPSILPALEECSVCLSGFETGEKVRFLPKCGHSFHIDCIDMWFHSHATCPVCRSVVEKIDGELVLSGDKRWRNKRMRIEVPSRTEFMKSESGLSSSPASQGFWTPGKRILSLNRIFSMGKKSADDSPVMVGDGPSNCDPDEMDLECGVNESTHRSHAHTPR